MECYHQEKVNVLGVQTQKMAFRIGVQLMLIIINEIMFLETLQQIL